MKQVLLICGILSALLYVLATILGAIRWGEYDSVSQTVSELIAIDAPSAPLVIPLFLIYSILVFAFGLGIWLSAGTKRVLRLVAVLVIAKEILGVIATLFAPMHMRGVGPTLGDTIHQILTSVGVLLCMFPAMGFAASALGKRFRIFTIGTMIIFLVFGILSGLDAPRIDAQLPTPWLGVKERILIYCYLLWVVAFSIVLLRAEKKQGSINDRKAYYVNGRTANRHQL